ncbi:MAG TPA: aminotransferase class I/II-fold pyridoxal phosphate-dependent enzyme [Acidimicrobiales bacterium]
MPDRIVAHIEDRSARGIAAALNRLIGAGELTPGSRLPTVRALAKELGVSPTTVSEAWQTLAEVGAIEARGRLGTFVRDGDRPHGPRRYRRVTEGPGHFALDLSTGTPDPDLLPDLRPVLARVSRNHLTTSYLDAPVLPELDERLRADWPFPAEAITVVDGAMDALDRVTGVVVHFGDRVLVENPGFAPLIDLLDEVGAEVLPLELDEQGVVPASLAEGLASDPVAVYLQPRAQNPSGVSLTPARARKLASLLRSQRAVVVEDDHAGDIATSPLVSLGAALPDRTVHIRSYSKSHGPDLRLAAVGGAGRVIEDLADRRLLGPGWSSRLLQAVLLELLDDGPTLAAVASARDIYAQRRAAAVAALRERGVRTTGNDGINLWVEVADEQNALVTLAARGIGAAPGTPFEVASLAASHLRVTIGLVRERFADVADDLARAAAGSPRLSSR